MDLPIELKSDEYGTSDLSLATYFIFRERTDKSLGIKFSRAVGVPERFGRRKRTKHFYVFKNMNIECADKLAADYANSSFPAFEGIRRGLSKQRVNLES